MFDFFGDPAVVSKAMLNDLAERQRRQAECSPHAWEFMQGMMSREWTWVCSKCGKYHNGIERPPAA